MKELEAGFNVAQGSFRFEILGTEANGFAVALGGFLKSFLGSEHGSQVEICFVDATFGTTRRRSEAILGFAKSTLHGKENAEKDVSAGVIRIALDASFIPKRRAVAIPALTKMVAEIGAAESAKVVGAKFQGFCERLLGFLVPGDFGQGAAQAQPSRSVFRIFGEKVARAENRQSGSVGAGQLEKPAVANAVSNILDRPSALPSYSGFGAGFIVSEERESPWIKDTSRMPASPLIPGEIPLAGPHRRSGLNACVAFVDHHLSNCGHYSDTVR